MSDVIPLLSIDGLSVSLPEGADRPFALDDVSFTVGRNEIVCVVGESGSGKSMTAGTIMRLLPTGVNTTKGAIKLEGEDILTFSPQQMRAMRGARVGMIFQEPMTALNPIKRIGVQIGEMLALHTKMSARERQEKVVDLLTSVQIPNPAIAAKAYPHELSGGQRQRAMIAMAMALDPVLLIADEPTTALDVTTQAQILKLIREMQQRMGTGVVFITHDFGVVADIADRVVVLQHGKLVEQGPAAEVLGNPQHPYTQSLIAAVPMLEPRPPRPVTDPRVAMSVSHMTKTYGRRGLFGTGRVVPALQDVSFSLATGRTLGIVGESGSGKSTLARAIVRLLDADSGTIKIGDIDFSALSQSELRRNRGLTQMVFQDPFASLNPRRKVGDLVAQPLTVHGHSTADAWVRAAALIERVGLDRRSMDRFPHEFSGGQRQRIGIARALALNPKVLVADEAVSALDVSIQARVLALLESLRDELSLSMVFITHDLRVTARICDEIAVMKDGRVVEHGATSEVFANPQHEYTRLLLETAPGRSATARRQPPLSEVSAR